MFLYQLCWFSWFMFRIKLSATHQKHLFLDNSNNSLLQRFSDEKFVWRQSEQPISPTHCSRLIFVDLQNSFFDLFSSTTKAQSVILANISFSIADKSVGNENRRVLSFGGLRWKNLFDWLKMYERNYCWRIVRCRFGFIIPLIKNDDKHW